MKRSEVISAFAIAILLAWALCATVWAVSLLGKNSDLAADAAKAKHDLGEVKAEYDGLAASCDTRVQEAEERGRSAVKDFEALKAQQEERLEGVIKGLHKLQPGENDVREGIIDSFEITGSECNVRLVNSGAESVRPKFEIDFLDNAGFRTDGCEERWLVDSIEPGETRILHWNLSPQFGKAVYYAIQWK